jgi:hypothetical protein
MTGNTRTLLPLTLLTSAIQNKQTILKHHTMKSSCRITLFAAVLTMVALPPTLRAQALAPTAPPDQHSQALAEPDPGITKAADTKPESAKGEAENPCEEDIAYFEKKYRKKITGVKPIGEYADPDQFYSAIAKPFPRSPGRLRLRSLDGRRTTARSRKPW